MAHVFMQSKTEARPADSTTAQKGFSVLEAIVAVAIMAAALLPFVEFQSQSVRAVEAIERVEARIAAEQHALASLEPVMRDFATARAAPPHYQLSSERVLASRFARGAAGIPGRFELRLVELTMTPDGAANAPSGSAAAGAAMERLVVVVATPTRPADQN